MWVHYQIGDRTAAIRQYQRCVQTLWDELSVAPGHETRQLYDQICADSAPQSEEIPGQTENSVSTLLTEIQRLQTMLSDLQNQIAGTPTQG